MARKVAGGTRALVGGAVRTAGELSELVAEAAENTLAFNPLIGIRPRDVAVSAAALLEALATSPRGALRSLGVYWSELQKVAAGASTVKPAPKDRRFADPAWESNGLCKRLMQAHGVTQASLTAFVEQSALDPHSKRRARFFVSLLSDALAPS